MPMERRMQVRRVSEPRSSASPILLAAALVFLAASLVAVGTAVVLGSIRLPSIQMGSNEPGQPPTRTPLATPRATPGVYSVGQQDAAGDATPVVLATPSGNAGGAPIFQPAPSSGRNVQPPNASGAGAAAATDAPATETTAPIPAGVATAGTSAAPPTGSSDPRVEQAFAALKTDEDKVGQLLLLGWIGSTAEDARATIHELRPGGIVFVQNATTAASARAINVGLVKIADQEGALRPLIAIDHEGGLVQRIKDIPNLGANWDFGARNPSDLQACQRGQTHAQQLSQLGFSMNLAPVLDVNNNPANPVIGTRSYGDDPELVARLGAAYIQGLQGNGIVAVGKHFPGHGNTSTDSHLGLPSLPQSLDDLEKVELVPFRRAIGVGVSAIMSAHIVFPAVDPTGAPATLSRPIMTGLLRERLGFQGLTISDDTGAMKAITDNYTPGDAAVRAVNAGVDLVIMSAELSRQQQARDGLLDALQSGRLSRERVDEAVRHVLEVKARYGLLGGPGPAATPCQ
ncbi:MAG: hypothetical protein IT305_22435 [Chloroflexi bacterium]|nr:hypothetical protein [Chloroflexota bacterium]